jgi:hypothetical protein
MDRARVIDRRGFTPKSPDATQDGEGCSESWNEEQGDRAEVE